MKPKDFKEANVTLTRPQALTDLECGSLNVYNNGRECISLWKPSLKERISILFYGNVWLCIHSGKTQPPVWIDAQKTVFNQPKGLSIREKLELFFEKINTKKRKTS